MYYTESLNELANDLDVNVTVLYELVDMDIEELCDTLNIDSLQILTLFVDRVKDYERASGVEVVDSDEDMEEEEDEFEEGFQVIGEDQLREQSSDD